MVARRCVVRAARTAERRALVVEVATQAFALDAADVQEVVRAAAFAPLPGSPRVVEGVLDVRGTLVPVVDLRRRFGLPERPMVPSDQLVVARAGSRTVAIRVDAATALVDVGPEDVASAESVARATRRIAGAVRLPDGVVLLIDLASFLDETERLDLDAALEAP